MDFDFSRLIVIFNINRQAIILPVEIDPSER